MLTGRTHLSAQEIAALALDGLPETKRGVQLLADRADWSWISEVRRGGECRLYSVGDLPERARRDLVDRWVSQPLSAGRGRPAGTTFWTRNPDVADAVEAYITARPLSATAVMELLATRFTTLPHIRSLYRFIAKLEAEKPALIASMRDPDRGKSQYRLSLGRAAAATDRAHQVWEIDTTKADVMCKEGRKSILGIVDVWSARTFYLVVDSESAQSVRRTLVACIRKWGVVPEVLRTDRGSGYINETIKTALPHLGILHDPVPPASGESKPFVERTFGTFQRERTALLDGFLGHNVAQAAKLRQAAKVRTGRAVIVPEITAAELQAIIDAWLDGVFHVREHGRHGMAPIARWMASPVPARAAPDEGALKLALSAYVGPAKVTKRGITWKKGRYWAAPLAAWMGRDVQLRRDEDDLGELYVFDGDGRYIATAVNHERSGLTEQAFAIAARREQDAYMKAARAGLREKQRRFPFKVARDDLLRADAEAAGKLVTLPVRTESHATPMLDSLADAPAREPATATLEAADALLVTPRRSAPVLSATQRIAETDRVLAEHAAGRPVDPEALRQARAHAQSSEYRADQMLREDTVVRGRFPARRPAEPSTPAFLKENAS